MGAWRSDPHAEGRLERTRAASQRLQETLGAAAGARAPADIVAEVDIQDRIEETKLRLGSRTAVAVQAEGKRDGLRNYTRPRTIKELESEVRKAHSTELAREATWELEKSKETEARASDRQLHPQCPD